MRALKGILSGFTKTIDKLEKLTKANLVTVDSNTARISDLHQQNLELISEAQAAKNIATNLRKLLGTETEEITNEQPDRR